MLNQYAAKFAADVGAVDGAKAYIEKTCVWINDYT
jgi:hypothetical protein